MRTKAYYELWTLDTNGEITSIILTQDFRHIDFNVLASGITTGFTLTVYKSDQLAIPDLSSAVSTTNMYVPVQIVNKNNGAVIDGSTGIVLWANGLTSYEVNDNVARWIGIKMTARTDGQAFITMNLANNQ